MRVFFDTNVLVSVVISREGFCAKVFREVFQNPSIEIIFGETVFAELERTLVSRFRFSPQDAEEVIREFRVYSVVPKPARSPEISLRDPDDALVLASALEAKADVLVTGDRDLLDLGDAVGIKILDPRALWELLTREK